MQLIWMKPSNVEWQEVRRDGFSLSVILLLELCGQAEAVPPAKIGVSSIIDESNKPMISTDLTIREAKQEDSLAIARILHALGWFEQFKNKPLEQVQVGVAEGIARCREEGTHTMLVAEGEQGVAGYISVHWFPNLALQGYDGYISELFVHPAQSGRGIGSALLDAIEADARQRGCTRLLLMNRRIRESYQRGFYTKRGWHESEDGAFFTRKLV